MTNTTSPIGLTLAEKNTIKAKLTFMVHGKMGRDWHSGREFILAEKGNEVLAIRDALRLIHELEKQIPEPPK